jgi:hypothetical protein
MYILLSLLIGLAGYIAWRIGRRGRAVDDHPVCRACRYDLSGLAVPDRCPECGADTRKPRAIIRGNRRPRLLPTICGIFLMTACLPATAWSANRWWSTFDWLAHKPLFLLRADLRSPNIAARGLARDEIIRRLNSGAMPPADFQSIVPIVLQRETGPIGEWDVQLGTLLAQMRHNHGAAAVSDADWKTFCQHLLTFGVSIPTKVHPGRTVTGQISLEDERYINLSNVDGTPRQDGIFETSYAEGGISRYLERAHPNIDQGLEIGSFLPDSNFRRMYPYRGWHFYPYATAISTDSPKPPHGTVRVHFSFEWEDGFKIEAEQERAINVELVPASQVLVEESDSPPLDAVERAIHLPTEIELPKKDAGTFAMNIVVDPLPVDTACTVRLRQNGKTAGQGVIIARSNGQKQSFVWPLMTGDAQGEEFLHPGPAEIVLQSNISVAEDYADITHIWKGEIHIPVVLK